MQKIVSADSLVSMGASVFAACGSSDHEALLVAQSLVDANLTGHDSHGIGMLPRYVDAVLEGGLKPNNGVKVVLDAGALLSLDGQRGYGQITGHRAMEMGAERAKVQGSCIVALRNTHHLGRIGQFAEMVALQGLVSLHFVNVLSRALVAPYGGADGRFGTNPCCIGIPLPDRGPFILDFATSRVAQGKMRVAFNAGRKVEPGILIDCDGKPTTDPGVVVVPQSNGLFGAIMAFGEHKGYGLAVACELLGGGLTGGETWHRATTPSGRAVVNGMLSILIDPEKLGTKSTFEQEASAFVEWVKAGPVATGFDEVQIAGDPERNFRAERLLTGIEIDEGTWKEIVVAGEKVGVSLSEK